MTDYSVMTLDQFVKLDEVKDLYLDNVIETEEELIKSFNDGFNFVKGQIVNINLTGCGSTPALVTKINDRDINGHLSYDVFVFIGEGTKSFIKTEERYLWRFVEKPNENSVQKYKNLIEVLMTKEFQYDKFFEVETDLKNVCYLNDNTLISYKIGV